MRHFRFGSRKIKSQRAGEVPVACTSQGPPVLVLFCFGVVCCLVLFCFGVVWVGLGVVFHVKHCVLRVDRVSRETLLAMVSCMCVCMFHVKHCWSWWCGCFT